MARLQQKKRRGLSGTALCLWLISLMLLGGCRKYPGTTADSESAAVDRLKVAVRRVEEERGTPTGNKAPITVPKELKHYTDRRRFLAVQNAAWSEWHYEIPQNYVELIELIEKGGFVEMEPLGEDYVLYGAGENATTSRFTHFDAASGNSIPLFADRQEWEEEQARLAASVRQRVTAEADLRQQVSQTPAKARAARQDLLTRLAGMEEERKQAEEELSRLEAFYKDPARSVLMYARYRWLKNVAANFRGRSYDIADPASRRQFKMRLLTFTRPQTRAVMEDLARAYHERFDRPLPVTSLYRTVEYQKQLREVNPNAARVDVPPHTTGLAFDIYDRYMNADEQNFLMNRIAGMKAQGRVEALRENRDHIHVFAFPNGRPPDEGRVAKALK